MKPIKAIVQAGSFFALLCLMASAAAAPVSPVNQSLSSQVLPVLVHVDSDGQITSVAPAVDLSPRLTRLLRSNLDDMITAPAVRDGRAVSSQFVIQLRMKSTPQGQDNYDVQFAYVSMAPVPAGSWYWVYSDNHRLMLARQGSMFRGQRSFPHGPPHPYRGPRPTQHPSPPNPSVPQPNLASAGPR